MPVINLPRDERWGDLGKGLGSLIENVSKGLLDKRASEGVAAIVSDPNISEADKPSRILKDFGDLGYKKYQEMIKAQVTQAQIKDTFSQIGLRDVQRRIREAQAPFAAKAAETDIAKDTAQIGQINQATARSAATLPGDIAQTAAQTAQTQAQTKTEDAARDPRVAGLLGTALEKKESVDEQRLRNAATRSTLGEQGVPTPPMVGRSAEVAPPAEQPPSLTAPGTPRKAPESLGVMLDPFKLTDPERKAAEATYTANERKKPGTGLDAAVDYAAKRQEAKDRQANLPAVDTDTVKATRQSASYGTISERFMNELVKDPSAIGLLGATGLRARLERIGLPTGDTSLVTMLEAQKQLVGQQAQTGSVFMSGQTIKLARDIAQNIDRSGMSNLVGLGLVADERLAELRVMSKRYEGNERAQAVIAEGAAPWERIKKITDSIQPVTMKDKSGNEYGVLYFMGNQVDTHTMKPLVAQDATKYKTKSGELTGVDLFNISRQLAQQGINKDPYTVLREMR